MLQAYHVELERVPTGLPAVLHLRGYDLNLQREKKEFTTEVHYGVHLHYWDSVNINPMSIFLGCWLAPLRPPEIAFSSSW